VILITYGQYDEAELATHVPRVVQVDAANRQRLRVAAH
jgi:aspartate 1-decarboxylase